MTGEPWTAGKILALSGGFWNGFALHAGVELNVFTLIGEETMSGEGIAHRLNADSRSMATLLNALAAMGLLVKKGEAYANNAESKSFLVKTSPAYVGYAIMHHHHLVPAWFQLSKAVTGGKPVRRRKRDETELESFLMGMFNVAMAVAPALSKQMDLSGRRRLLDLGGGPGTYAVHFCLANPSLKATVFDLPTTRPFAEKTIARFGLSDRIEFQSGDYLVNEIGGAYDVAWLSQILHSLSPQKCQRVIKKAVSVLESGGMILVHEFILDDTKDAPLFPALFSLNMLVNTRGGRSYSEGEIRAMLAKAGIKEIVRLPFKGPSDSGILCGTV